MKVKTLEQRHPDYDGDRLGQFRALYEGGKRWEALVSEWLPAHPQETPENYEHRKRRALYHNHAGPIVDLIAAFLFSQGPEIGNFERSWFGDFSANVDREGTSLELWFKRLLNDALVGRWALAWVNLPAIPEGVTFESRGDQERLGLLDAYLDDLDACQIIDWERDSQGKLVWVMVRDELSRRDGPESPRRRRIRWTSIDAELIRRWEWTPPDDHPEKEPSEEDEAQEQPAIAHGFGELPLVELRLPPGLHAMGKLHHPAIAHMRARNDLSWALHRGAHPLLVIQEPYDSGRPVLGSGAYLRVDPLGSVSYAEPSGASFQLLADDVVQLREELYRVVHQMAIGADSSATRSKMSGESKKTDWQAMEIVLASLAEIVKPALAATLRLVDLARGTKSPVTPTIGGLEGWQEEDLETWLAAATQALDAAQLSPTFRKEVAKRQARRVLTDASPETLAKVDGEIDAADTTQPSPHLPPPPAPPGSDPGEPGGPSPRSL